MFSYLHIRVGGDSNTAENELKESIILENLKKIILGSSRSVCWSKHGIFPHQGFHSYCTCQGIIPPLSPTPDLGAEKIPHILYNLLQHIPAATANNTSISCGSRQTAPSAAIWALSETLSNASPDKAGKIQHNISETYPITSVTGLSRGMKAGLGNVDESAEGARKPSTLSQRWQLSSYREHSPRALIWG